MPKASLGKSIGLGVKFCHKCRKQGHCIDTRHQDGYIRRRYSCVVRGCKNRWTSIEYRISTKTGGSGMSSESAFMSDVQQQVRQQFQKELAALLGFETPARKPAKVEMDGVDIDAIHRKRA